MTILCLRDLLSLQRTQVFQGTQVWLQALMLWGSQTPVTIAPGTLFWPPQAPEQMWHTFTLTYTSHK